jgi:quercetin dioxygenase-like cupin family protein
MPGIPSASVFDLSELASFSEGAVVSRMLVKSPAGSVTLFAFAAGEGLSEHTAPFDALLIVTDGTADVGLKGATHRLGVGQTILLPAGVPHSVAAPENVRVLLVMLRTDVRVAGS